MKGNSEKYTSYVRRGQSISLCWKCYWSLRFWMLLWSI